LFESFCKCQNCCARFWKFRVGDICPPLVARLGVAFLCLLCACLPNLTTMEGIDQQLFAKTKKGYISLPSDLNAIIGITSYYCVILKMMILHDAIKTIQNRVFVFFSRKRTKTCIFSKNEEKQIWKKLKNPCECFVSKPIFFNPDYLPILFCDFPLIARTGTMVTPLSVWLGVRPTPKA